MFALALQAAADGGSQIEQIARTFGVDWPHLLAQFISFGIVCALLYRLAYTPILKILEARRQQIADGLANADKSVRACDARQAVGVTRLASRGRRHAVSRPPVPRRPARPPSLDACSPNPPTRGS